MGRYEDNGDGTVSDCRSGLIWLKDANCTQTAGAIVKAADGWLTWNDAVIWTAGLGHGICGLSDNSSAGDWRMPTKTEWKAMIASARKQGIINPVLTNSAGTAGWLQGDPFNGVQANNYWSATAFAGSTDGAWVFGLVDGGAGFGGKAYTVQLVWPVRSGQ
jgi:hypothetical protein